MKNCKRNVVIYLKINHKLFRGIYIKATITHMDKFGYEERQKKFKKKSKIAQKNFCTYFVLASIQ